MRQRKVVSKSGRVHLMHEVHYVGDGEEQWAKCHRMMQARTFSPKDDNYRPRCRDCFPVHPVRGDAA